MVTLQQIFDDLASGEGTNMAIAQSQLGTVSESNYPKVISLINRALVELAKRFVLKIDEVNVHQIAGRTKYQLIPEYAGLLSECGSNGIFIEQSDEEDFEDNLIKILYVYDTDGIAYTLNDTSVEGSLFTPEYNVLQMTPADPVEVVSVEYQAELPRIKITDDFDPEQVYINIPRTLIGPVNIYVVHLLLSGMHTNPIEGQPTPNTTWLNRFELVCRQLVLDNVLPDRNSDTQNRFDTNGFV